MSDAHGESVGRTPDGRGGERRSTAHPDPSPLPGGTFASELDPGPVADDDLMHGPSGRGGCLGIAMVVIVTIIACGWLVLLAGFSGFDCQVSSCDPGKVARENVASNLLLWTALGLALGSVAALVAIARRPARVGRLVALSSSAIVAVAIVMTVLASNL